MGRLIIDLIPIVSDAILGCDKYMGKLIKYREVP